MTIWATGLATRIVLRKSVLRLLVSALRHHHGTFQLDAGVYENLPYILFLKKVSLTRDQTFSHVIEDLKNNIKLAS
jgi:hypothetical protein